MKIIEDKELYLDDKTDLLETKKYADVLKDAILNIHTPSTIGLFGEWGSGKSSIIKTVQNDLEKEKPNIKFITYDAWKYQGDSFRRTFLIKVAKCFECSDEEMEDLYVNKTQDKEIKSKINTTYLCYAIILVFIVLGIYFSIPWLLHFFQLTDREITDAQIVTSLMASVGLIFTFVKNVLTDHKTTITYPLLFSPEQFGERFQMIIDENTAIEENRVVIVIDNLDRCNRDVVCQMLGDIKGFLEKNRVVFVIPVDEQALLHHLKTKDYTNECEAEEFLRKIFDVIVRIKTFQTRDLFAYIKKLLENHSLELKANTISVIIQEYASNPRRIIQFLNNFQMEKEILCSKQDGKKELVENHESLIALLLILREEWFDFYQEISKNPKILINETSQQLEDNPKLSIFLQKTKGVWKKADLKIMEQIVFNLNEESRISPDLREKIEDMSLDVAKDINKENFDEIMTYLLQELEQEVKYETFDVGALNLFRVFLNICTSDFYNQLNSEDKDDILNRVMSILENSHFELSKNLNKQEYEQFAKFIEHNREYNNDYLVNDYRRKLKELCNMEKFDRKRDEFWCERFVIFFNGVKIEDLGVMDRQFFRLAYRGGIGNYLKLNECRNDVEPKNILISDDVKEDLFGLDFSHMTDEDWIVLSVLGKLIEMKKVSIKEIKNLLDKMSKIAKREKLLIQCMTDILQTVEIDSNETSVLLEGDFWEFVLNFTELYREYGLEIFVDLVCELMRILNKNSVETMFEVLFSSSKISSSFEVMSYQQGYTDEEIRVEMLVLLLKKNIEQKDYSFMLKQILMKLIPDGDINVLGKIFDNGFLTTWYDYELIEFTLNHGKQEYQDRICVFFEKNLLKKNDIEKIIEAIYNYRYWTPNNIEVFLKCLKGMRAHGETERKIVFCISKLEKIKEQPMRIIRRNDTSRIISSLPRISIRKD